MFATGPITADCFPGQRIRVIVHDDCDGKDGSAVVTTFWLAKEEAVQFAYWLATQTDEVTHDADTGAT